MILWHLHTVQIFEISFVDHSTEASIKAIDYPVKASARLQDVCA